MKKILFTGLIATLAFSSCTKTKTCTCKDSSGEVLSQTSKKTNNKADLKKFEDDCKNNSVTVTHSGTSGNSTTTIPCEIN